MADNGNLIPFSERSKEEARENGRKGGIASGAARRRKKAVREIVEMMATQPVTNEKLKNKMRAITSGVSEDDIDLITAATMGIFQAAIKGNDRAYKLIAEYMDQVAIDDQLDDDPLSASLEEFANEKMKKK